MDLRQGFVLTRHWRDTPSGIEVDFWLATDDGPQQVRLPYQTSTAFIPTIQSGQAQALGNVHQQAVLAAIQAGHRA